MICLALLIFSLIEREVRLRLAEQGRHDMVGFYAFDNRAVRPTARLILQALHDLRLIPAHDGSHPKSPTQAGYKPNSSPYSTSTPPDPAGYSGSAKPCANPGLATTGTDRVMPTENLPDSC